MEHNKLGNNIKALRTAFGETQEQLGACIYVEKNTISNYEKGNRKPDKETIELIAQHYMISTDELMHSDLSALETITVNKDAFWENIEYVFPIFNARDHQNKAFQRAYKKHCSLYEHLKKQSMDGIEDIDDCMESYLEAYGVEKTKCEAAANFIAIWYLIFVMLKLSPIAFERNNAALVQIANRDPRAREILENTDPNFGNDARAILDELNDPELKALIEEMKNTLKHTARWSDLADYYLALQFVYNLVDNELEMEFNQRIGVEMMSAFMTVKNVYAARFIKISYESVKGKFTD